MKRFIAASAATAALMGPAAVAVADQAPTPARTGALAAASAGASGIGDPYFPLDGNGGYDVAHYDIHDGYSFDGRLWGWTRVTARATQDLSAFNLDLLLGVKGVMVNGVKAAWSKPSKHELRVVPAQPIAAGDTFTVRVQYAGRPGSLEWNGEASWQQNTTEAVAMNQPHIAAWWFPANDHPRDKARFDIRITVPRAKKVVANGRLMGRTTTDTTATYHWKPRDPMATYLAFFAAGNFRVEHSTSYGRPMTIAVSRSAGSSAQEDALALMRRSGYLTHWLETQVGEYPFESTGGIVVGVPVAFALENQTRPTYPFVGRKTAWLVVHELAHQWFGDSVAVHNWRDIWLNEGFATFMEWRYWEVGTGGNAQQRLVDRWADLRGDDYFWEVPIGNPGPARIFEWAVYERGAMAVQALRHRIGEANFWSLLRSWVITHRNGNASVRQFILAAEEVSGQNLDGFFQHWLYDQTAPAKTVENGLDGAQPSGRTYAAGPTASERVRLLAGESHRH